MRRVRMLTTAASPDGVYHRGEVWQVGDAQAAALVAGGYAAAVDVDPLPAGVAPAPETASVLPGGETAALPQGRRKRGA